MLDPVRALLRGEPLSMGIAPPDVTWVRRQILEALGAPESGELAGGGPDPGLFRLVTEHTEDPDDCLEQWLRQGAPLGISCDIPCRGIFPETDSDITEEVDLDTSPAGWKNYGSAEDAPAETQMIFDEAEGLGFCRRYANYAELRTALGTEAVTFNKIGLIGKQRKDGTWKYRVIWDMKESKVNRAVKVKERVVLPRLCEAVGDAVHLTRLGSQVDWMVIDIKHAFHNIPTNQAEWRYCCAVVNEGYYVFRCLPMGLMSSVPLWGRYAAWLGRTTQAVLGSQGRIEVYVDDPIVCATGTPDTRAALFTKACLWIGVCGFPLAWEKAAAGSRVAWIGAELQASEENITAHIPEDKIADLTEETKQLLRMPVVAKRRLRTYAGKLNYVAGIISQLRPFVACLWAPIADKTPAKISRGLTHIRRVHHALRWLLRFFTNTELNLTRAFPASGDAVEVYIHVDASPWGLGGLLVRGTRVLSWFADGLTANDLRRFRARRGDSKFMPIWESLAILVAARTWLPGRHRIAGVVGDSTGSLALVRKLHAKAPMMNLVAQELALDEGWGRYTLVSVRHIPGVTNLQPDALSRLYAPEAKHVPPELQQVPRAQVAPRGQKFWKSL